MVFLPSQLITPMNLRPCGYTLDTSGRCRCTADQSKLSGPLLDRTYLHIPKYCRVIVTADIF